MALLVGCTGGDGPDRVPMRGSVTRDGSPVAQGTVSLLPAEGHSGPAATTAIEQGRFEFDGTNGPAAGPHRLVVSLGLDKADFLATAGKEGAGRGRTGPPVAPSAGRWEFRVDVPKQGPFEYDITLD